MKEFLKQLASLVTITVMVIGAFASVANATLKVVQTPTYHLYSGESTSATTMRITPYPVDLDKVKLTMTDFGDRPTVTVDPKIAGIEEIEQFTGITDNGDNTATLTGLSRDLQSKSPYTGTGTGRTHGGGATVVFGNNPQIYGRLAALENAQTWSAVQTFGSTTQPIYDGTPTFTNPLSVIDKAYADALSIVGAPTSTELSMGVVRIASALQVASSTASSTQGQPYVISPRYATDTPQYCNNLVAGPCVVMNKLGKNTIDASWTDLTSGYSWTGIHNFSATTTMASSTMASSTISGTTNTRILNVLGQAVTATSSAHLISSVTGDITITSSTLQTPIFASTTISANTLSTGNVVRIKMSFTSFAVETTKTFTVRLWYGTTLMATGVLTSSNTTNTGTGWIEGELYAAAATNAQEGEIRLITDSINGTPNLTPGHSVSAIGTAAIDSTADQSISITGQFNTSNGNNAITINHAYIQIIR